MRLSPLEHAHQRPVPVKKMVFQRRGDMDADSYRQEGGGHAVDLTEEAAQHGLCHTSGGS
jgi:hypothetical protein